MHPNHNKSIKQEATTLSRSPYHPPESGSMYDSTKRKRSRSIICDITVVCAAGLFWMLCFRDQFFGWLILGSSAGLLLDGALSNTTLRAAAVGVVPLMIPLAATAIENFADAAGVDAGLLVIATLLLWIECLFIVTLMLGASMLLSKIVKALASHS